MPPAESIIDLGAGTASSQSCSHERQAHPRRRAHPQEAVRIPRIRLAHVQVVIGRAEAIPVRTMARPRLLRDGLSLVRL